MKRLTEFWTGSVLRVLTQELKIKYSGKQSSSTEGYYLTPEVRLYIKRLVRFDLFHGMDPT